MQLFKIEKGPNDYHLQDDAGSQEKIRFGTRARNHPE